MTSLEILTIIIISLVVVILVTFFIFLKFNNKKSNIEENLAIKSDDVDEEEDKAEKKSKEIQKTIIDIKKHFGKNAVLKGIDLTKDATARERNRQIGGHKSGEK